MQSHEQLLASLYLLLHARDAVDFAYSAAYVQHACAMMHLRVVRYICVRYRVAKTEVNRFAERVYE